VQQQFAFLTSVISTDRTWTVIPPSRRMRRMMRELFEKHVMLQTFSQAVSPWRPFFRRWRDGDGVTHAVRSQVRSSSKGDLVVMWWTACNSTFIAHGKPAFAWDKRAPTCLACVSVAP
jgi:hypothetical protein